MNWLGYTLKPAEAGLSAPFMGSAFMYCCDSARSASYYCVYTETVTTDFQVPLAAVSAGVR